MTEQRLTAKEMADIYRYDVATVYRRVKSGEWPAEHDGRSLRFVLSDVEAAIASRNPWARSRAAQTRRANKAARAR